MVAITKINGLEEVYFYTTVAELLRHRYDVRYRKGKIELLRGDRRLADARETDRKCPIVFKNKICSIYGKRKNLVKKRTRRNVECNLLVNFTYNSDCGKWEQVNKTGNVQNCTDDMT